MRLDGTNAVEGRRLLADHLSDSLIAEPTMLDAARHAVALAPPRPRALDRVHDAPTPEFDTIDTSSTPSSTPRLTPRGHPDVSIFVDETTRS